MHHDRNTERCEGEYFHMHIRQADLGFGNFRLHCGHRVAQVAFRVEEAVVLVSADCVGLEEVHPGLAAWSVSVHALVYHFCNEGSRQFHFHNAVPGVVLSQFSPFYTQELQHSASSLPGPLCKVSWSVVAFLLLRCAKTLLWLFWLYSRQYACLTVSGVPDRLALPYSLVHQVIGHILTLTPRWYSLL